MHFFKLDELHKYLLKKKLLSKFTDIIIKYRNKPTFTIDALYKEAELYNNQVFFVLLVNKKQDDIISMCRITLSDKRNAYILSLVLVNDIYRNNGYGTKMIHYLIDSIKNNVNKYNNILLTVDKNNLNAILLYKKLGFIIYNTTNEDYDMVLKL
jgi:ribosomal protein S18 acetylase RimI-like enzyme